MSLKEIKRLLKSIREHGLVWDLLDKAEKSNDPQEIREMFRRFHSKEVYSILFEDDRFLTARERESTGKRGGFNPIVRLEKDPGGIARAVRNIRL